MKKLLFIMFFILSFNVHSEIQKYNYYTTNFKTYMPITGLNIHVTSAIDSTKSELSELKEKWVGKVFYVLRTSYYDFNRIIKNPKNKPKKYAVIEVKQTTNYSQIPNRFHVMVSFDSGDTTSIDRWEFEDLLRGSESKESKERGQIERREQLIKEYLNKVYYVCWSKRFISSGKFYYLNCKGEYIEEVEILNISNNTKVTFKNGEKYVITGISFDNENEDYTFIIEDERGGKIILKDYFYYFIGISELEDQKKERVAKLTKLQSKYGIKIAKLIMDSNVQIGMTKEMCRLSWGEPKSINTTTTRYGSSEQWVYKDNRYLYFEKGILTTIQD